MTSGTDGSQPTSPALKIGTRGSQLARWQAEWVKAELEKSGATVELVFIETSGDQSAKTNAPIESANPSLGGLTGESVGVFTKAIQDALLDQRVDIAVHSLKDLPTEPIAGLELTAVPRRAPTADALISRSGKSLAELPSGAKIGTGSLRRKAQLLHWRSDLRVLPIRGNLDTRLQKLDHGDYDAIILAEAGLTRLNWQDRITEILPPTIMLPAIGQGALGIETRANDRRTEDMVVKLNHLPSMISVLAERALLHELRGGCLAPVGAHAKVFADALQLSAAVLSVDGSRRISASLMHSQLLATADPKSAAAFGREVAHALQELGAEELISAARNDAGASEA